MVAGRGKTGIGKAVLNKRVSKSRAPYPPADSLPRSGLVQDIIRDASVRRVNVIVAFDS